MGVRMSMTKLHGYGRVDIQGYHQFGLYRAIDKLWARVSINTGIKMKIMDHNSTCTCTHAYIQYRSIWTYTTAGVVNMNQDGWA